MIGDAGGAESDVRVEPLADMVAYQEGAVVSRTLVNKGVGTITLFAFDEGESLSEHTSPYDAFVLVVDGEGEFEIDGQGRRAGSGETIVMPAGRPHAVRAPGRFKMLLVMIRE